MRLHANSQISHPASAIQLSHRVSASQLTNHQSGPAQPIIGIGDRGVQRLFRVIAVILLGVLTFATLSFTTAAQAADLLGIRFGPDGDKTRIVIDVIGQPEFDIAGNGSGFGQLTLDLPGTNLTAQGNVRAGRFRGKGHVGHYQLNTAQGAFQRGTQITFDLGRTARIDNLFVLEPRGNVRKLRIVIDLYSASKSEFLKSLPKISPSSVAPAPSVRPRVQAERPRSEPTPSSGRVASTRKAGPNAPSLKPIARLDVAQASSATPNTPVAGGANVSANAATEPRTVADLIKDQEAKTAARNARRPDPRPLAERHGPTREIAQPDRLLTPDPLLTIVIDPGHGGGHPGAVGKSGTLEKDVNLAAAKELAKMLNKKGRYRIVMTRVDDKKVELERRAQIAREVGAKLFISLHADGNDDATLRGTSVYTLSAEGEQRSAQEAQEQKNYQVHDIDLSDQPAELRNMLIDVAQDANRSATARFAGKLLTELGKVTPLIKNAQRKEDLKVLLRPDVPAVLLEMAFISNTDDEKLLSNAAWRRKTMAAVVRAIDAYFEAEGNVGEPARG